jgi:eukaryotic-like serine/threonine-protein kinase
MRQRLKSVARLFAELRRRRVFRALIAYLVAAWVVIEVSATILPYLGAPPGAVTGVIVAVGLGLPVALALAWAYDLTPGGVRRTPALAGETAEPAAPGADQEPGPAPEPESSKGGRTEGPEDGRIRLIAIPFRMLRPDPETEFLAFSLPDAVTSSLAAVGSVVVRSQLAAVRFGGETPDLEEIAARSQVDVILGGTLVRIGGKIGITAHLTDVREGTLLWSESTQVELGDLFQIQEQLVARIVDSLRLPLTERERGLMGRDVPADPRAYELYLRANGIAYQAGRWAEARDLYLESVGLDPGYAPAWARLARCHRLIGKYTLDARLGERSLADAVAAFERALDRNPDLSLAHNLYAQLEVDLGRAESAMARLLARARENPQDAQVFAGLVHACRFLGLLDASLAAHGAARRLDPEIPTSVSHTYWMRGDYDRVLEHTFGDIGYVAGVALASLGRTEEAVAVLRRNEGRLANDQILGPYLASLRALLEGKRAESLEAVARAVRIRHDGEAIYYMARTLARLGETGRALDELETVVGLGFVCVDLFRRDPWLDTLREDARFEGLLARADAAHLRGREAFRQAGGEPLLTDRPVTSYTAPT